MNNGDRIYNRKISEGKAIRDFPRKVQIMLGSGLLIGLCIALVLFVGFIRGLEFSIRHF